MSAETPLSEAFTLVVELAEMIGVSEINKLDSAWICKIDDRWTIAINGKSEPVAVEIKDSMGIDKLDPYHMAIFFNGWLAGLLTPVGGTMCAGEAGNEDNFIKAVKDRIAAEKLAKEMLA